MAHAETLESEIKDRVGEFRAGTEKARHEISKAGQKIKTQLEESWDDLVETVKRHPGKALGITLAAGFAVGGLVAASSRRRSSSATDQLKGLAGTGAEAWDRLRSGFEEAACSLKDAVDDAVKKFK